MEPYAPFVIASLVLGGLVAFELAGTFLGFSGLLGDADADGEAQAGPLDWLNPGRVPLSVLLMVFLGLFSAAGFALQAAAGAVAAPLPALSAAAISAGGALIATGRASQLVSRILPRDETYAAHADDLIGRVGVVTLGPLGGEHVGQARIVDDNGNVHFPLVRPQSPDDSIPVGAEVVLVSRKGREFLVARRPVAADTPKGSTLDEAPGGG